jgi:hypothetical protein
MTASSLAPTALAGIRSGPAPESRPTKERRPDKLGVSVCALLEVDDLKLKVKRWTRSDGTPVLDIKPRVREFEPIQRAFGNRKG